MPYMRALALNLSLVVSLAACSPAVARPAAAPAAKSTAAKKPARSPADKLAAGIEALEGTRYSEAEPLLKGAAVGKQRGDALVALARLQLETGRYDDALKTAQQADGIKGAKLDSAWIGAEALRRQGKLAEAEARLRKVESEPEARRARLELGELLLERGKQKDATPVLMTIIEDYNDDKIKDTDGPGLAMVGRAAHLLRSPRDANDAFNQAERAKDGDVQTLLWRGELFLEKYDPGHAEEVIKEVLAKAPNRPEALVWMAHVKLAQALDFDEAERLAKKALSINPKITSAHFVLAGIALRDMDLAKAEDEVKLGLAVNPRDLDLLSMHATARFLADDTAGFNAATQKVLALNPQYSRMYQIIGEFADWEHRYDEIVAMMKKAVQIDPDDAKAYAQLGLNLIRAGNDKEGVQALNTAFDKDPFNVRVYNTLNLYEKVIPKDYVTVAHKTFTFRYRKDEKDLLERYIPGLLDSAWRKFTKKYAFTPSTPIGVELYGERENFAIRTSGLPSTAIQGVCFGKTLAAMSPHEEKFNIGMTVWHELAHVFHIQMSKSHVPRWFTEGLAEYETLAERPEWSREHDPALYEALRSGRLPKVGAMSQAFTRAEEMSDVATAYYASSQIMVMLVDKHGMPAADQMLKLWGEGKGTPEVVQTALGMSTDAFDTEFRTWADQKLARYKTQFVPISRTGGYEKAKEAAEKAPKDPAKQAAFALAALRERKVEEAHKALEAALAASPDYPDALWLEARLAMSKRDMASASTLLQKLTQKSDGYMVQMALADISEAKGDVAGMKKAFERAHQLDPTQAEPLQALVDLAKKTGDKDGELDGLRKLSKLEEHDGRIYRRLMRALMDKKLYKEAKDVGEMGLWADLEGAQTHALFAEALAHLKMVPRAIYELESALMCPARPKEQAELHAQLAETYMMVPNPGKAREHAKAARKLDPDNPRVKKLKI